MGVAEDFRTLCSNLAVPSKVRSSIAARGGLITRSLNLEFWNTDSQDAHSLYTGSYGRYTAIEATSDVDMIVWLPPEAYVRYNRQLGNGQSAMLQDVRNALKKTYPTTQIGADGQVVVISFTDGLTFEVMPAFLNQEDSFAFPDSNSGGTWKTTNPRPEIAEMNRMDKECNYNLKNLCKMARAWKREWNVSMGGLLIDTLAYYFMRNYKHRDKSYLYYDFISRDFFEYLRTQDDAKTYWLSPGANQYVWRGDKFQPKATRCKNIAAEACQYQGDSYGWAARQKWREIYGTNFPQ